MELIQIQAADRHLLEGIAATMAESARLSGDWLVCRPGCTECCMGPFGITRLDELRLKEGLSLLETADPPRAAAVRARAAEYVAAIAAQFPGDLESGELLDEDALPESMEDVPCPALDPATGCCDLYAARPITCRTFGPATRAGEGMLAACELCYLGASDEEMERCAVGVDPEGAESRLTEEAGLRGMTIVAFALTSHPAASTGPSPRPAPGSTARSPLAAASEG